MSSGILIVSLQLPRESCSTFDIKSDASVCVDDGYKDIDGTAVVGANVVGTNVGEYVDGIADGSFDGVSEIDGRFDGVSDGTIVGADVGLDGIVDGSFDGILEADGKSDGIFDGTVVGLLGNIDGFADGEVGTVEGEGVGPGLEVGKVDGL
mmetsp:Transcript_3643/g.4216  ORF Transcript_3643/g.4216 Transcript_3643/m.4216 type:complete len:151 (+) Transcript_3643:554-1006(+)